MITSHSSLLEQLPESQLSLFPTIIIRMPGLLYHYCGVANSATALRSPIFKIQSEKWLKKQLRYYDDCREMTEEVEDEMVCTLKAP